MVIENEELRARLHDDLDTFARREHDLDVHEIEEEQDVPVLVPGLTSSIGALWPPDEASFERIKGIYSNGIVEDKSSLSEILVQVDAVREGFGDERFTRVSIRAVVDRDFLERSLGEDDGLVEHIEAMFSLEGAQEAFRESALVYFGTNSKSRNSIEIDRVMENYDAAMNYDFVSPEEVLKRVNDIGYDLMILEGNPDDNLVNQVSELYQRFGWAKDQVAEILANPSNIIAVAQKDGEIVSAGIAEMAEVPIGDNTLRIVEITEAATKEEHARRGLYTAVSTTLLKELAGRSVNAEVFGGKVDLVYGECNGLAPGVLKTAKVQGRTFAIENGFNGYLSQHVPIEGEPKITKFNDLLPAGMTGQKLEEVYA